jgi:hypothetical protein
VLNPNFSAINTTVNWNADSYYHALQTGLKRTLGRGAQFIGSYTWSKSIDTGSSISSVAAGTGYSSAVAVVTPLLPGLNRGLSDYDLRHNLVLSVVWDVPLPGVVKGFGRGVLGGWQLGGIYRAQTSYPFSVVLNNDRAGSKADTTGGGLGQRPNLVVSPSCSTLTNPGNPDKYIKTECFTFPAQGLLGTLGRNTLTGPGLSNFDFSLVKNSRLTEALNAQLRVEFFNALNHPNFSSPAFVIFDNRGNLTANAGLITTTRTTSRQIQLGLKLIW